MLPYNTPSQKCRSVQYHLSLIITNPWEPPTSCFHYPRDICGSSQGLDSRPFIFANSSLETWLWAWFSTTFLPELPDLPSTSQALRHRPPSLFPIVVRSQTHGTLGEGHSHLARVKTWFICFMGETPKLPDYTVYPKHARNFHIETNFYRM